ncbi:MAG: NUDIX domain-containing protein [Amphiplicatus sp.]
MSDVPIPAATVLLLRDAPRFEVLMIERHADIGFAGGALVFPGGRVDPGDRNPAWGNYTTGLDPEFGNAQIAAAREAFEEVGILLAREKGAHDFIGDARAASLSEQRKAIEQNDALFLELIRDEGLELACDRLRLFAHWIAPPGVHKRFDTWFFAAECPVGQQPLEDGDEATEALWIAPEEAIAARRNGARKIIFPTARNLELLTQSRSITETFEFAARRPIRPVQPDIVMRGGVSYLTIPTDLGYPVTEEPLDTAMRG